jgi:hypothetical protein
MFQQNRAVTVVLLIDRDEYGVDSVLSIKSFDSYSDAVRFQQAFNAGEHGEWTGVTAQLFETSLIEKQTAGCC